MRVARPAAAALFPNAHGYVPDGFEAVPMLDVELRITELSRHGAPMTLVRGWEDRDVAAIVAMGQVRAGPFRFHVDRDVDLLKYVITKKRLLAGLAPPGTHELQFVIAEEGITAAAYVVISIVGHTWTLEECGDRDPSGARVGALLQTLIAREPVEQRPIIRAWLPSSFQPPQVTVLSARISHIHDLAVTAVEGGCIVLAGGHLLTSHASEVMEKTVL